MLFFTACDSQSDEETDVFSISEEKRKEYKEKIDKLLYDNYWRYDGSSITFFKGNVPENTEKNKDMFEASSIYRIEYEHKCYKRGNYSNCSITLL